MEALKICSNKLCRRKGTDMFCSTCGHSMGLETPHAEITLAKYISVCEQLLEILELIEKDELVMSLMETLVSMATFGEVSTFADYCKEIRNEFNEMEGDNDYMIEEEKYARHCRVVDLYHKMNISAVKNNMPEFEKFSNFVLTACNMAAPKDEEGRLKFKRLFGLAFVAGYVAFLETQ